MLEKVGNSFEAAQQGNSKRNRVSYLPPEAQKVRAVFSMLEKLQRGPKKKDPGQIEFIGRQIERELVGERMGTNTQTLEQAIAYFTEKEEQVEGFKLKQGQFDVFVKVMEHFAQGNKTGHIELPPGFGKTVIASWLIECLNQNAIIIAPTGEIVNQFQETLKKVTKITKTKQPGQKKEEIESIEGETETGQKVVITTHAAFRQPDFTLRYLPWEYPFLVIDEAHEFLGPKSMARLKSYKKTKSTKVIGLTATGTYNLSSKRSFQSKNQEIEDIIHSVAVNIGPKIVGITLQEALDKGMACPFEVWRAAVGVKPENLSGTDGKRQRAEACAITIQEKIAVLPELFKQGFLTNKKAFVRCKRVSEAENAAQVLKRDCPEREVFFIEGKMSDADRDYQIKAFKESINGILCGSHIVGLGLDVPDASVMVMLEDTKSSVQIMQTAGRVIRMYEGKKLSYIIHISSPLEREKREKEVGTYVEALKLTEQGVNFYTDAKPITLTINTSHGGKQDVCFSQIGKAKKNLVNRIPEGFIPLSKVFGHRYRFQYDSNIYVLSLVFKEIKPDEIYVGSIVGAGLGNIQNVIHPPTIYLSPKAAIRCNTIHCELTGWNEDQYVTTSQIAEYFGMKHETIVRKLDKFYPISDESELGITKQTDKRGGGHLVRLFPKTVLDDKRIGELTEIIEKNNPEGVQIWFSETDLRTVYPGFPHYRFKVFAKQELQSFPQWTQSVFNTKKTISTYYHDELVQKFLEQEIKPVPENWFSRNQIHNQFGIRLSKLDTLEFSPDQSRVGKKGNIIAQYFSPQAVNAMLEEFEEIHGAFTDFEKIVNVVSYRLQFQGIIIDNEVLENIILDIYGYSKDELLTIGIQKPTSRPRFQVSYIPEIMRRCQEKAAEADLPPVNFTPLT